MSPRSFATLHSGLYSFGPSGLAYALFQFRSRILEHRLSVCVPSGVELRFPESKQRTTCPLGTQATGLCSDRAAIEALDVEPIRLALRAGYWTFSPFPAMAADQSIPFSNGVARVLAREDLRNVD